MLKDYLPIVGMLLFVWFWIENSWAQVVMDFFNVQENYLYIIGVINVLFPIILFALVLRFYIIPYMNSQVFNVWYKTTYRLLNEIISLDIHKDECEELKVQIIEIKQIHDRGTLFSGWTTWFIMIITMGNMHKFIAVKNQNKD